MHDGITFAIGVFIGAQLGLIIASLMVAAGRGERW